MTSITIQVSREILTMARSGELRLITCHLDPGANKTLQEEKPALDQVTLTTRHGGKTKAKFAVIGSDVVLPGYQVRTRDGRRIVHSVTRRTARVILGPIIEDDEPQAKSS